MSLPFSLSPEIITFGKPVMNAFALRSLADQDLPFFPFFFGIYQRKDTVCSTGSGEKRIRPEGVGMGVVGDVSYSENAFFFLPCVSGCRGSVRVYILNDQRND